MGLGGLDQLGGSLDLRPIFSSPRKAILCQIIPDRDRSHRYVHLMNLTFGEY
jgi:hypothetical protein